MFKEWDQSGLTPALVDLAPKIFALDEYSQAQLFAYEQEMVSPLAIPAEAWSSFWHDYDKKADITRDYLAQRQGSFNFSDHFDLRADNAVNALDGIADLEVAGGYRIAGIGARPPSREVPAVGPSDHLMLPRYPIMFHYSPFRWGVAVATFTAVVVGAVNTTAAVPSVGLSAASIIGSAGVCAVCAGWEPA